MEDETIGPQPSARVETGIQSEDGWDCVDVLGVEIACVDPARTVGEIRTWIEGGERTYLCLTGVHGVMEAQWDPLVRAALDGAGMDLPDGMPMVWAGKRAGSQAIDRVYGPDLMLSVCAESAGRGWPVFFYGGQPGVADKLSERMAQRFPGLEVAGTHSPPMREPGEPEDAEVIKGISQTGARIVFVGISTPKQELWMANHLDRIAGPVILIGVGAAFDIHAGLRTDAPAWVGKLGLHWLYRLAQEPRRLWRRYLSIVPGFLVAIAKRPPRLVSERPEPE